MWPPTLVTLRNTVASLAHRSISSPKGSRTTTWRLPLWQRWRRRSSHWHWSLPIYIVSCRFPDSLLSNGGSMPHFEVICDVEESNPLTVLWWQVVTKPFNLCFLSRCGAYLYNFRNSAEYYSIDMFSSFRSWKSGVLCCRCARGKKRSLNSRLKLFHVIGTPWPNSSVRSIFLAFH
jgi:hypothetical protein